MRTQLSNSVNLDSHILFLNSALFLNAANDVLRNSLSTQRQAILVNQYMLFLEQYHNYVKSIECQLQCTPGSDTFRLQKEKYIS